MFSCDWIGFVANFMQLFHLFSICEIKCYKEHIKSNKLLFIGKEIWMKQFYLCLCLWKWNWSAWQKCEWSNLRLLGREWNLRWEKWAKFYSHSWDWTRARKIWEIDPSHFWSLPFWLITLAKDEIKLMFIEKNHRCKLSQMSQM